MRRHNTARAKAPWADPPLLLVLSAVCFAPLIEGGTTHLPVFILELIVILMLFIQARRWSGGGPELLVSPGLDLPLALFFLASLLAFIVAPYKYMALTWVQLIIYYSLFYLMARTAMHGTGSLFTPVLALILVGSVEIAAAGWQWHTGSARVDGTFFNPNMLAGYIAVPSAFALSLLMGRHDRVTGGARKYILAGFSVACLVVVVLSGSRGGMVSFAAGSFVVLWFRSRAFTLAFAAALAVAVFVFPNPLKERIYSDDPFAYSRIGIWSSAAEMAYDHPLGVGLGNFKYEWYKYSFPIEKAAIRYGKKALTAHNEYLHFTAEMGVPGLLSIMAALFVLLRTLVSSAMNPAREDRRPFAVGALAGVSAVLVHSAVDSNFHEPGIVFTFILTVCIGLESGVLHRTRFLSTRVPPDTGKRLKVLLYVLAALLAAWNVKLEAARYYFDKGGELLKSSGPSAASALAERAVLLAPGQATYHEQLASVKYALYLGGGGEECLSDAMGELSVAESLNPHFSRFPSIMAKIKVTAAEGLGDPAKARALMESALADTDRALESSPFDAELIYSKATLLERLGDAGRAEELLAMLRDMEPNFLRGRYALAVLYWKTGRKELSRDECYSIIRLNKSLSKKSLDKVEANFVYMDMQKVDALLDVAGGRSG